MKNLLCILLIVLYSCSGNKVNDKDIKNLELQIIESELQQVQKFKHELSTKFIQSFKSDNSIIEKELNSIKNSFDTLRFLKLSNEECTSCMVKSLDIMRAYKKNNPNHHLALVLTKDQKSLEIFQSQFELHKLEIINLKNNVLSILDNSELSFFGVFYNGKIHSEFPTTDLLLNYDLIQSFFNDIN